MKGEKVNNQYELINFTCYNPNNSLFKSDRNDRATYTTYFCNNKENCDAYKRGKCVLLNGLWGQECPYGKRTKITGPTKTAKSCWSFISDAKAKYEQASYKLSHLSFLSKIGDYVYIDLPHLKNYVNTISQDLISDGHMISANLFTDEFIDSLVKFRPRALMGGEIESYQKTEVPKFITQLKKYMPDRYEALLKKNPSVADRVQNINYVDKLAAVKSLLPGKVKLGIDILDWDGTVLKTVGKSISFWGLCDEPVTIIPNDKTYVRVIDNNTVTDDTSFRDE